MFKVMLMRRLRNAGNKDVQPRTPTALPVLDIGRRSGYRLALRGMDAIDLRDGGRVSLGRAVAGGQGEGGGEAHSHQNGKPATPSHGVDSPSPGLV